MIARPITGTYSDTFAYEPTTVRERASAGGVAVALLVAPLLVAPFARLASGPVPTFVATVETVVVTAALFTASMLYAQFRMQRYAPLAILSVAYALLGLMHAAYLLTYQGAFAPNGLLGAGPETAPWLGAAARIGFALVVMAYVYVESRHRSQRWKTGMTARICTAAAAYVALCVLFATLGHAVLPDFIIGDERIGIAGACALGVVFLTCTAAAIALAVYCGPSRRVHLWLTVVMLATAVEVLAAGFLGGARFTLGWYLAQVDLTIGATLFFVVMQSLLGSILRRAARNGERAVALAEIVTLGNDSEKTDRNDSMLERAARDLQFSWAYLAGLDDEDWITLECSMGDTRYPVGYRAPLARPGVREALETSGLVVYGPGVELPWIDDTPGGLRRWSVYVTVPIFVEGSLYGFAGFASIAKRDAPLTDQDRSFLELVGSLAGATIERSRQRRKLDELAFFDGLTGLPNRVLLLDRLQRLLATATRYDRPFAIHYLDLDGFKEVNDTYGHAAGDAVLREVARRLESVVRDSDTVARLGGDEFVVVQPQLEHPKDAERLAARLRAAFEEPITFDRRQMAIGTSIGTSRYPRDGRDITALMSRADEALYRVKERKHKAAAPSDVTFVDRLGY
jgi:diguanylate cyclase (GGDEF)-like protein